MTARPQLRLGSLCSGYGGLDLAVSKVLGAAPVWHGETDPGASAILTRHWPNVPNLGDITAVDFRTVEPVDVLTAGFPCQDVSLAGRRAGITPGTRSGLWAHVARAVEALRPSLVVIENVRGLLSAPAHSDVEPCPWCLGDAETEPPVRALGAVLADLADLGFDAEWAGLPASAVLAAHERWRVFLLAFPSAGIPGDPGRAGGRTAGPERAAQGQARSSTRGRSGAAAAHAGREGLALWSVEPDGPQLPAAERGGHEQARNGGRWGVYSPAVARWEQVLGRPAPAATDERGELDPRFVEWLMGLPEGWVTDTPGLDRKTQLRALGNGVVPQQAATALQLLLDRAPASVRGGREWAGRVA